MHLYNLAKLRKWKKKYTIQLLKVECSSSQPILASPPKMKKMPTTHKIFFWEPKSRPHSLGEVGGGTMQTTVMKEFTHFMPLVSFIRKLLLFSWGKERDQWHEIALTGFKGFQGLWQKVQKTINEAIVVNIEISWAFACHLLKLQNGH